MSDSERWSYILALDDELLQGGVVLSEWSAFLVRDADKAFVAGANLSAILAAQAAIEAHLRFECVTTTNKKATFFELINQSDFPAKLKDDLHALRIFRNRWVHVNDPADDRSMIRAEVHEAEIEEMSYKSIRLMREVLYLYQAA